MISDVYANSGCNLYGQSWSGEDTQSQDTQTRSRTCVVISRSHREREQNQGVASQLRALKVCLEKRFQRAMRMELTCIPWLMRQSASCATCHLGEALSRFTRDGKEQEAHEPNGTAWKMSWARAQKTETKRMNRARTTKKTG